MITRRPSHVARLSMTPPGIDASCLQSLSEAEAEPGRPVSARRYRWRSGWTGSNCLEDACVKRDGGCQDCTGPESSRKATEVTVLVDGIVVCDFKPCAARSVPVSFASFGRQRETDYRLPLRPTEPQNAP
jgi:hypothetical protein